MCIVSEQMHISSNFLDHLVGVSSLVFIAPLLLQNHKGNPLSMGIKCIGYENFCGFQLKSPFISEIV